MDTLQTIILALIQGFTEFLPVSSSAHLILPSKLIEDWPDQGLAFDIAVHVGTLLAVVIYFRKSLIRMAEDSLKFVFRRGKFTRSVELLFYVMMATVPAGLCGLAFKGVIETYLRSPLVIAGSTIVFGLLLWAAEVYNRRTAAAVGTDSEAVRNVSGDSDTGSSLSGEVTGDAAGREINFRKAVLIGCAQALALIPGTSRSGITITAGYFLKLSPKAAAEFSFLMSIPVILLSALMMTKDVIFENHPFDLQSTLLGLVISFAVAYLVIKLFLDFLNGVGLLPYVIYRIVLGIFLFAVFWPK